MRLKPGVPEAGSPEADDSRPLSDAAEQLPEIPEAGKKSKRGKAK